MSQKTQRLSLLILVVVSVVCNAIFACGACAEGHSAGDVMIVRASYYGGNDGFNGKVTANCTVFRDTAKTAAHKTLPLGTVVKLTNPETEVSEVVTITDRGPYVKGRDLDVAKYGVGKPLSVGAATPLEMKIVYVPQEPIMGNACRYQ